MIDPSPNARRWIALAILAVLLAPGGAPVRAAEHGGGEPAAGGHGGEAEKEEGQPPLARLEGHTELVYQAVYTADQQQLVSGGGDKTIRVWDATELLTDEEKKARDAEKARKAAEERAKRPWFFKRWYAYWFGPKTPASPAAGDHGHAPPAADHGHATPADHGEHASSVVVDEHHSPAHGEADAHAAPAAHAAAKPSIWARVRGVFSRSHELPMATPTPAPTPTPGHTPPPAPVVHPSKELKKTISDYPGQVLTVALTPDSRTVIAGGDGPLIAFFDLASGRLQKQWRVPADDVRSLSLSPDGKLLASASGDESIRIWDMKTGKTVKVLRERWLTQVAFSHDGKLLAASSGTPPGHVNVWEVRGWRLRHRINTHQDLVYSVAFSPDDKWFVTAGEVQKAWDTATGKPVMVEVSLLDLSALEATVEQAGGHGGGHGETAEHGEAPPSPAAGHDEHASGDHGEHPGPAVKMKPLELRGHDKYAMTVAISAPFIFERPPAPPKKKAWFFKRIWWWCCSSNPPKPQPDPTPPPPRSMPLIATGAIDNTVRIWDSTTGDTLAVIKSHKGHISSLQFNKAGSVLVSTSWDKTIRAWDVAKMIQEKIVEKLDREKLENALKQMREKKRLAEEEAARKAKDPKKKRFWLF